MKKENRGRRLAGMIVGNVILALGIALFRFSCTGNDAYTAMNIAISNKIGWQLGNWQLLVNIALLVVEFLAGRQYIGWGTIVNGALLGYMVTFFYNLLCAGFSLPVAFLAKIVVMLVAMVITSYGSSLYQASNEGIAPYDYAAICLRDHLHLPYFGCRVFTDALCALIAWLSGGLIGIGTLVCTFLLGPLISLFTRLVNAKLLGVENQF
ncbi:MAG: hypothetical protein SOI44_04020 [Lactimicrobium sp.]|uniref:YczE/YyaS/YitT family protein n=1 Tax=Lactimicrobium sp. TaxID=2563780 RepID=UPI002F352480